MPVLLAAVLALQGFRQHRAVDPATYTSPSGAFELHVEPSRIDGGGAGSYRMLRDGFEAWSAARGFTLLDARVGDGGQTFGYALSEGWEGSSHAEPGEFHVVVLGPDGAVLQDERHARVNSRFIDHDAPDPRPLELLLAESGDAAVLRVADPDLNRQLESWWVYRLSTGERLAEYLPAERLGRDAAPRWVVIDADAVPGAGLVLASGYGREESSSGLGGQWFALLEPGGAAVWSLADDGAFAAEVGGLTGYKLLGRVRERGALLPPGSGADFRLWRVAEGAAVDYRLERDASAEHGWRVVELGRTPDAGIPAPPPAKQEPERVQLRQLASFRLEGPVSGAPELGPVEAWAFDDAGGLRVVRRVEQRAWEDLRLDPAGRVAGAVPFDPLPAELEGPVLWTHLAGERWLATVSPFGVGARSKAFFADGATGVLQPLEHFACPAIEEVAATPEGGFVALAVQRFEFTQTNALIAFGPDGTERWRLGAGYQDHEDPASLFSPAAVAVTPEGKVAVLENIRNALQLFDAQGAFLASVDLEVAWGEEPRYPAGIGNAPGGGLLVHDFGGAPPLRIIELDGCVRAGLAPRRAAGGAEDDLARAARFAPDGALWTCDGERFYRLDDAGREVAAVGPAPSAARLQEAGASTIDRMGRICVQDLRNGVLHVWDGAGKHLLAAVPDPTDLDDPSGIERIVAGPDGGFVLETERGRQLCFDAAGARLGFLEEHIQADYLPGTPFSYVWGSGVGLELRSDGATVVRVERLPSRRWLAGVGDVFPFADGSFALLGDWEVALYGPGGEPRMAYPLPRHGSVFPHTVTASERWILVSGFEDEAWLIDRRDSSVRVVVATGATAGAACELALALERDELLALDKEALVVHRYALP